ncbi:low-density lipoprotein receptor-related protein 12-like [Acanthaster planci]|uniref:Low-density lipoprotein receptor-related protein 12-like n=1 Tax=Acanthaster planci TaxID=133434 RepID=A0A8B7XVH3_ACAPL|nr:low-density lipoprotein receptor-related protein 12-like [Acanthaster planci]
MTTRDQRIVVGLLLPFMLLFGAGNATFEYMNENCDGTIDAGRSGGDMLSQAVTQYNNNVTCTVTITADVDRRILLTFNNVDIKGDTISGQGCDGDYLEVFDGSVNTFYPDLGVICGTSADNIVSQYPAITLRFKTDASSTGEGFSLSYTSFTTSDIVPCDADEFECNNKRCIDASLRNDFSNNCGDNSDEDLLNIDIDADDIYNRAIGLATGIVVAIIIGCIVVVVLIAVGCGCLCYHCCCKNQRPQQVSYQVLLNAQQEQQASVAVQPAGQPVHPNGQLAYPTGQPAYPTGQPAYPASEPAYPANQQVAYADQKI